MAGARHWAAQSSGRWCGTLCDARCDPLCDPRCDPRCDGGSAPRACPQEVFDVLCAAIDRWSGCAAPGAYQAYLFESSGGAPRKLLANLCTLLAHPLQRVEQDDFRPPFELQ